MVGSSMIVEMLSARNDVLRRSQYDGELAMDDRRLSTVRREDSKGKDSALIASPLGISCGPSEAIGRQRQKGRALLFRHLC